MTTSKKQNERRRRAEEQELLLNFRRTGDPQTREEIVERFMPLAVSLAQRYRGGAEAHEDLRQIAFLGLLKAIDRYDPSINPSFVAFATPTILGELRHHFRDRSWTIRLPRSMQEYAIQVSEAENELRGELARSPTVAEVAGRCEIAEADVIEAMRGDLARRVGSLDRPQLDDGGETSPVVETLATVEPGFERTESELASERAGLRPLEKRVLHHRFHEGLTQREIGERIGVSQMQVSRLLRSALEKLLSAVRGDHEQHEGGE